jgi:exopolysaccharide/PEP-CTERM locus tyrosine autokinase
MTSLIEQAAKRLEQLRQAGADAPAVPASVAPVATQLVSQASATPSVQSVSTAEVVDAQNIPLSRRVELDLDTLSAAGIVSPHSPRSQVADQFRVVKRPLIKNAMGKGASVIANGNLIMVTSSLPGEGKSFTAINLAMSIATELDNTVMLVDADVARPSVMNMLGLPASPGLLDLVLDETKTLADVLLKTNIEKLTILPSGTPHARATELLASDAMVRLLDDISARYSDRIIVFDSPPLLITTEARVLASHMGQIVFVVHAGKTLQSEVKQALDTIEACPIKLMLLNKASTLFKGGYGYGYGYGDGYGYGREHEQA